ncbi:MAG: alpha/beta hydrolase [Desulfobacteraceae bacterium]|nr:alpha/beta hydrolase [Desulfobacteraceae bacterium]
MVKTIINRQTALFFIILAFVFTNISCLRYSKGSDSLSHFAKLDDIDIHYKLNGKGKETILFIHGWSCDNSFWRFQISAFADNYRVIAVDLPGHGLSSKPNIRYSPDFFADAVKSVLDETKTESAVLVGHSSGFAVARQFALKYPKRCRALCSTDGVFFRIPENPQELAEWKKQNNQFVQSFKSEGRREYIEQFLNSLYYGKTPVELRKEIKSKILLTPDYVANSTMEEVIRTDIWKDKTIKIPLLALYAKAPDLPRDTEQYLRSLFPVMEYHEWDDTGHFPMMEKPERFNRLLLNFMAEYLNE